MKKYKNVIITIILGALGSALWELCIKQILFLLYSRLLPYILVLLNDAFYAGVARSIGSPAYRTFFYFLLLLALFLIFPSRSLHRLLFEKGQNKISVSICKFFLFILIFYEALIVSLSNSIARRTLNNIEIVSPYISELEYKSLKSSFYQMDTKSDYMKISSIIESVAAAEDLNIQ